MERYQFGTIWMYQLHIFFNPEVSHSYITTLVQWRREVPSSTILHPGLPLNKNQLTVMLANSPEVPCTEDLGAVWYHAFPRQEGESEEGQLRRIHDTLERHYRRHGWRIYDDAPGQNPVMGRFDHVDADGYDGGSLLHISRDQPPAEPAGGPSAESPAKRRSAGSGASTVPVSSSPPAPAVPTSSSYRQSSANRRASSDPFVDTP